MGIPLKYDGPGDGADRCRWSVGLLSGEKILAEDLQDVVAVGMGKYFVVDFDNGPAITTPFAATATQIDQVFHVVFGDKVLDDFQVPIIAPAEAGAAHADSNLLFHVKNLLDPYKIAPSLYVRYREKQDGKTRHCRQTNKALWIADHLACRSGNDRHDLHPSPGKQSRRSSGIGRYVKGGQNSGHNRNAQPLMNLDMFKAKHFF
jgi:hypothetical protein